MQSSTTRPEDMLNQALQGNRKSLEEFSRWCKPIINKVAREFVYTRHWWLSTEDARQELWLALLQDNMRKLRKYAGGNLVSYIYHCLRNVALDLNRKLKINADSRQEKPKDFQGTTEEWIDSQNIHATHGDYSPALESLMQKAASHILAKLEPHERELLEKGIMQKLQGNDLAGYFNVGSVTTVYTRKNRLLNRLRTTSQKEFALLSDAAQVLKDGNPVARLVIKEALARM
jgi:DNA-directed RNA polymerase specialized sigma24 family protein